MRSIKGHPIRCILFDLGSTLWIRKDQTALLNMEQTSNQCAVEALRHHTNDVELSSMETHTLGILLRRTVEKQIRFETRQNPAYEPDFIHATMEALQQLGISKAKRTLGEEIYEALRIRIPGSRTLFDDTLSTLTVLKQRGYILGVVTNRHYGGRPFLEDLHQMDLLNHFEYEHMAISADLGVRKPNPEIFMHALNKLSVLPEEAAMVGDSLKADILGARLLNMLAIWKPNATLREEAKVAWISTHIASRERKTRSIIGSNADMAFVDEGKVGFTDDYLLTFVQERNARKYQQKQDEIKPDIIIENLKDLLTIF